MSRLWAAMEYHIKVIRGEIEYAKDTELSVL